MEKAKIYDWKDSNMALFGSDSVEKVKKESAEREPAWKDAGQEIGLQIWRIVKFEVTPWPKEDYGKFYNGDSYIVLNTYKDEDNVEDEDVLLYDIHFWIGKYSSQDEYGTARNKTVELDTFLEDVPVQHREVQGHESQLFRSYFDTIQLLKGGAESGFRKVMADEYEPRLLHVKHNGYRICCTQVPLVPKSLDRDDVFILDLGLKVIQWNGSGCRHDEKFKAAQEVDRIRSVRGNVQKETVEEGGKGDEEFRSHLNGEEEEETSDTYDAEDKTKELHRLSDASGEMKFTLEKKGSIERSDLDSNDVFILDTKSELYVWIGKDTSNHEKQNAMKYAHNYLKETDHPLISVTCLCETQEPHSGFEAALSE